MDRPIDRQVYEGELCPWLPETIIDCHVHVSLPGNCGPISQERRAELWPVEVGLFQSWDELRTRYAALFPRQRVHALAFGGVLREQDISAENDYVFSGLADPANDADALLVTRPEWNADEIEAAISDGYAGIKPYPDLALRDTSEISIYDFLPNSHLAALDRLAAVCMLHLPRAGRLGDPDNIRELREIAETYPSIKLIVAHVGRAYCLPTAQRGLPHFADTPGVCFDISANLNGEVFQYALETIGPDRLLFGSDLPITMMRGYREHTGEKYINYTDGNYSWNTNRKSPGQEANYTFYVYEELRALIGAVKRAGMGKAEFEKIMYSNVVKLLRR